MLDVNIRYALSLKWITYTLCVCVREREREREKERERERERGRERDYMAELYILKNKLI